MIANTSVIALLRQALQARQQGREDEARAALAEVLRREPGHADALHLLGEMAQAQGRLAEAATLLMRSVQAQPRQAFAWSRLAAVQEDLGDGAAAEASLARAAELLPDHVDILYNRARVLRRLARPAEAAAALARALRTGQATPLQHVRLLQLQALLEEDAGDLSAALATLDRALHTAPDRAALHHNRGTLLQRLARPADALDALDRAVALGLDTADTHYNRGNSLQSLGHADPALAAYRAALLRQPQHALALYDMARLRWRLGDAQFAAELEQAARADPASPVAPGILGRLMLRGERVADAVAAFEQAIARAPHTSGYHDGLGQALARLGRHDEAIACHRRAVALAPDDPAAHVGLAGALLQAGDAAQAEQSAQQAVQLDPLDQQAWATLGLAWRALGNPREAWLNDYRLQVWTCDVPPPDGWHDLASFNAALADALHAMHTDAEAPIDQTLRHGSQTLGNLFDQDHPLVRLLQQQIAKAIDGYIAHLAATPADTAHPLRSRVSSRWRFTDSWSSRLRSGGFHTRHVHPHGWISSCYYVALPTSVASGTDPAGPQAGWISFGTPDISIPGLDPAPRRVEQPRVGRLVLFPSFMWHGTVPFTDTRPRLTVAFDVVPD